ncbi:MAG: DNRLRE domain-containing protein [PVC group bacterium]
MKHMGYSLRLVFSLMLAVITLFFFSQTTLAVDTDGDGWEDEWEEGTENDRNAWPDGDSDVWVDIDPYADDDGDGLINMQEAKNGTNPFNPDTDFDGVLDGEEDNNGNGMPDGDEDYDEDGLSFEEEQEHGTNPAWEDTDGDGLLDGGEIWLGTDPLDDDSDDDGVSDGNEQEIRTDPLNPDSDGNGISDGDEDYDGDGLTNKQEDDLGTNLKWTDTDKDGLSDYEEVHDYPTDPCSPDTDRDGFGDGWEIENGQDPMVYDDSDGDGLSNDEEANLGTDPDKWDSDDDGYSDKVELDFSTDPNSAASHPNCKPIVLMVLGEAYSFSPEINDITRWAQHIEKTTKYGTVKFLNYNGTDTQLQLQEQIRSEYYNYMGNPSVKGEIEGIIIVGAQVPTFPVEGYGEFPSIGNTDTPYGNLTGKKWMDITNHGRWDYDAPGDYRLEAWVSRWTPNHKQMDSIDAATTLTNYVNKRVAIRRPANVQPTKSYWLSGVKDSDGARMGIQQQDLSLAFDQVTGYEAVDITSQAISYYQSDSDFLIINGHGDGFSCGGGYFTYEDAYDNGSLDNYPIAICYSGCSCGDWGPEKKAYLTMSTVNSATSKTTLALGAPLTHASAFPGKSLLAEIYQYAYIGEAIRYYLKGNIHTCNLNIIGDGTVAIGKGMRTLDSDGDGWTDWSEISYGTLPSDSNSYPDGSGNVDSDGDGFVDSNDISPTDPGEWKDSDGDGIGDNSDEYPNDYDNDGWQNSEDAFPADPTEWKDSDKDGLGDNADPDDDNDGVEDGADAFPFNPDEWKDSDGDGIGDNSDYRPHDYDNDGSPDNEDAFPRDPDEWKDTDKDGTGDNADLDDDNDGLSDSQEAQSGTDPKNPDPDKDGLTDGEEIYTYDTDPNKADTDGDGLDDGREVILGTDPNLWDSDKDGRSDGQEISDFTDPNNPDSYLSPDSDTYYSTILPASQDSFVRQRLSTTNYGSDPLLKVEKGSYSTMRTLISFDLSQVSSYSSAGQIKSAELRLYEEGTVFDGQPLTIELYQVISPWQEQSVTWANQPGLASSPALNATITTSSNPKFGYWHTLDITSLVKSWVSNNSPNHGVLLKAQGAENTIIGAKHFPSSESYHCQPELKITFWFTNPPVSSSSSSGSSGSQTVGGLTIINNRPPSKVQPRAGLSSFEIGRTPSVTRSKLISR